MKLLIVDDEAPARERLRALVQELDDCEVLGEADTGERALALCSQLHPDAVLLDMRMPGMSGLQVARHITAMEHPPAVIFTTAYDSYAVEAFETEAMGYLLKPVRKEKLAHALRHAARLSATRLTRLAETARIEPRRQQICARLGEQLRLIPVSDIFYFFAEQKYVTVHHRQGANLIDDSLKALSMEFPADFVRIHRNALVAEKFIAAVERSSAGHYVVRMRECDAALEVSRRHSAELLRRIRGEAL